MKRRIRRINRKVSQLRKQGYQKWRSKDPIQIFPYRGYASKQQIFIKGRVLEDAPIFRGETRSRTRNVWNSIRRFETDEIPNYPVRIHCNGQTFETTTDYEGYFTISEAWNGDVSPGDLGWVPFSIETDEKRNGQELIQSNGEVCILPSSAEYGIITDIDDTVLQTHVSSLLKLRMMYTTFFKSAYQRLPMEGIISVLQAFEKGSTGDARNPIFYLSHSPWNLYDLLEDFFEIRKFPKGPILLRDFGIKPAGPFGDHKLQSIFHLLETYPTLPFILLGDSAERDADFYLEVARKYPSRILAIYIRQVKNNRNANRIKQLLAAQTDIEAHLVTSSQEIQVIENQKGRIFTEM